MSVIVNHTVVARVCGRSIKPGERTAWFYKGRGMSAGKPLEKKERASQNGKDVKQEGV